MWCRSVLPPGDIDFRWAPDSVWTLICLPDDPHKSLVREDGALLYDFTAAAFDEWRFGRVFEFGAQTTHRPRKVTQWTESARRPIVHTRLDYPRLTLKLTAFATVEPGCRHDVVLWTVTAAPDVDELLSGLTIDTTIPGQTLATRAVAGPHHSVAPVPTSPWPPTLGWTDDLPHLHAAAPSSWELQSHGHPLSGRSAFGFKPVSGLMTRPHLIRGGESHHGAVVITIDDPAGVVPDGDAAWAAARLTSARQYWDELEISDRLPSLPDPALEEMLVACARNIMQAREIEDGLPVLQVGPTIYRGLWLVDGHFMLETARYLGWDAVADAGLNLLLRRVREDGSIRQLEVEPHLKETAIGVSTIVRQAELTGNLDRLRAHWPVVDRAITYIRGLRAEAATLPEDHPFHGLMPPGFADGGLGGLRAEYTTVAWTLIGLRYAWIGAGLLGQVQEAFRLYDEYLALRDAFTGRAAQHRRLGLDGVAYLPMVAPGGGGHQFLADMEEVEVPRWRAVQPETATWALCHAVWPGEVFAPGDDVVRDLLAVMDSRDDAEGIPATTGWLPWEAVWTYGASFAAHAWLFGGRADKAVDYLYAFANHASPTRVWREEQPLTGSGNLHICGDMPHNWASAELIRLARHLLVFERGDGLDLLAGVPESWWADGSRIRLPSSPTRFGSITLDLTVEGRRARLVVHREAGSSPVGAALFLPAAATVQPSEGLRDRGGSPVLALAASDEVTVLIDLPA